ncbi:N-acetylmuramoyl-L-alanine amidase [Streptomyces sp. TRM 70351]|uniref:N-acetylmuramoyl-L-alanine amidase n=1 Tax=Streptomyces sp. TRM 70351 TaxID=3116552 RepID=UPI002E7B35FD|nr:N-acetylmuramoyl-L-alanine amidase [Streptomyces sp. TRM 70351]MEE1927371.1 N-acetylmuramoyl-L-alanine amidase [Streptomyces sp. TRM 70351]
MTAAPPDRSRRGGRRVSRRALLLGGTAAVLGGVGLSQRDELAKLWYQVPGNEVPRKPGEVDYPGADWVAASSQNWRLASRPLDFAIDRVVVHVIQGSYATALDVFQNPLHRAATHYVVRTSDGRVAQTVRELDVAYHAGNRSYNERSIGIEHEGFVDRPEDFTDGMYRASARLTADICDRYSIPKDREHIVGHNEVPGADHTDPGPHWDWERYLRMVRDARPVPRTGASAVRAGTAR